MKISEQLVVVTGGARGLGTAIVRVFDIAAGMTGWTAGIRLATVATAPTVPAPANSVRRDNLPGD